MGTERTYSDQQVNFARSLYVSGSTLKKVSRRTGIPVSTLSRFSKAGKWLNDRMPPVTVDDLFNGLLQLAMRAILKLLFHEASRDEETEEIDKMRKYVFAMKALCEITPMQLATVQSLMMHAIEKHGKNPALPQTLDILQEYHDSLTGVEPSAKDWQQEEEADASETQAGGEESH